MHGDREWALEVLRQTLTRLREEYAGAGKEHLFECLQGFLQGEEKPPPLAEAARILEMEDHAARLALQQLKRRFAQLLRDRCSPGT